MNTQPTIIRKHWFGLVVVLLIGLLVEATLVLAMYTFYYQGALTLNLYIALSAVLVVVLLATVVVAYVYRLSNIVLANEGIAITNWSTLFFSRTAVCEWSQVQDVTATQDGVFAQLLGFGTLLIQTAGTERNLKMTMVPRVQHWRSYVEAQAASAPTITQAA